MIALRHCFLAAALISLTLLPLTAHAATLNVPAQYATIQAGVDAATDGDTVLVADGTYTGDGNRDIDFGGKNITVKSVNGPTNTIIDCGGSASTDGSGNHRGFFLHSSETSAVINGFTVKNGYTKYISGSSGSGSGGGIYVASYHVNTILVTDCTVTENTASSGNNYHAGGRGSGGGIFVDNYGNAATGSILVTNCIVTHCTAVDNDPTNQLRLSGSGGGVCALDYGAGSISITDCSVTGNTAERGAGIYTYINTSVYLYPGDCTISMTHCTVNGNTASDSGGGIFNFNLSDSNSLILVNDCTVNNNKAPSGAGGGIDNENEALTFTRVIGCTVNDNMASYGGGIFNDNYSDTPYFEDDDGYHEFARPSLVQVIGCAVRGNTVLGNGGGIYNYDSNLGVLQMVNCTVTGNTSDNYGGGVYNDNTSTSAYDDDDTFYPSGGISTAFCTITANSAVYGGGGTENRTYYTDALADVTDCIVYNNLHGEVSNVNNSAKNVAVSHSDVQGGHSGTGNIDADPLFVDAANGDFHLQAGSPVLGKGVAVSRVTTDKDSVTRPNPPSIGAYEYATTLLSMSPTTKTAGSSAFTLTVTGSGFLSSSVVEWNGTALTTTFVSATELTAFVPASLIAAAGIEQITVSAYGAPSRALIFAVTPVHLGIATVIAAGPDGKTRILWNRSDGAATVWTLNADGSVSSYGITYGPFAGWTAKAVAVGPDNATHLLWNRSDGRLTVWTLPADGSAPLYGPVYGPYAGWSANSIATGSDGNTHVLWTHTDGRMLLWTVSASGTLTYGIIYGPYAGWTAKAIATGSTSNVHMLWTNASGAMTLWTFPATGSPTYSPYYGPYTDWTATSIGVDAGGAAHVLWDNTSGAMTLWTVPASGSPTFSPIFGPYAGYSAVGLSLGADDDSHVLWDNVSGAMTPWTLDPDNQFVGTFPTYGPYS